MNVVIWKQQFSNCSYPRIPHTSSGDCSYPRIPHTSSGENDLV